MTSLRIVAAVLLFATPLTAQTRDTLVEWMLEDPAWSLGSEPIEYTDSDVETLVGDNTPSVLEYGLIGATLVALESTDGSVQVALYEMIDSTASYGLFALERDWRSPEFELAVVGIESYESDDRLVFWQSNFVVELEGPRQATRALGELIADNILGRSRKAPVSLLLPAEGLIQESEKYILTPAAFQTISGLDPTELGFENSVEVTVAEYIQASGRGRLALLLYPTQQLARLHSETWIESFEGELPSGRSVSLFAILLESDSDELSESIMSALSYQSEVTWTETLPDPLTLPQMILTIFTFIGIALAFTLVVGLVFGGFRIYMKTHYPGLVFGSEEELELIQLKLHQSVTTKELNP